MNYNKKSLKREDAKAGNKKAAFKEGNMDNIGKLDMQDASGNMAKKTAERIKKSNSD